MLVAVLSVTALLALMLGGVVLLSRGSVDTARLAGEDLRVDALLRSGVQLAGHQLFVLGVDPLALSGQQVRLDDGTVTLFAASEAGRVDLNGADEMLLAAAYQAAGLSALAPADFAARVADWRDADDTARPGGAEAGDYRAAGFAYTPPDAPFRTVADLQFVLGLSAADVAALGPFVTVSNPSGKIDPMFAAPALLSALPGLPPGALDALADARARSGLDRLFHLRAIFRGLEQHLVLGESLRVFSVRVEARASPTGTLRTVDVVLIAPVLSDRPFQITDWRER